jgi:LPS export ABC transporter protein LptC
MPKTLFGLALALVWQTFGSINANMINATKHIVNLLKAICLASCFCLAACENTQAEIDELTAKKNKVEVADSVLSYMSQEAKMKARLKAPKMLRYITDSPKVVFPNSLHVDFYGGDSTLLESVLNAKYGDYKEGEHKVFLKDSVVVFNQKGDTMHCKELYWDQQKAIFYTDKAVAIRKPDVILYGRGLVADQNFKWYTITTTTGVKYLGAGETADF